MRRALLTIALLAGLADPAAAQVAMPHPNEFRQDQPAFFQADSADYDRDQGVVTLRGHVELWQDPRLLLADQVTYDRNTGVAHAHGHVILLEADGQTVFADDADLSQGMKDGVLMGMRALLADNGRLVANGARRTDGTINELARMVYSTCNLCQTDPSKPPLWQIRAREAVQDTENKMIEYRDAVVDIYGYPVMWLPYLSHPDPSQKRASGLLTPDFGVSKHLGAFIAQPWYWVIDGQSDATITPLIATRDGPMVEANYRHRFNDGMLTIDASVANEDSSPAAHLFSSGKFAIDDTWRWGFDIQRTTSLNYMRDFHLAGALPVLTSQAYIEGFGQGAWTRLDVRAYQPLTVSVPRETLPYVLPRYEYSFFSLPDPIAGGRFTVDAGAFNIFRYTGTNTQRASLSMGWQDEAIGRAGEVWNAQLHLDTAAYIAHQLDQQPNFAPRGTSETAQAMPTLEVKLNWPLARDAGSWGTQIVEPIAQILVAPRTQSYVGSLIPNEDSLDQDFTDANLFAVNRFPGIDRLEGGMRANVALHAAWYTPAAGKLDALVGEGFRARRDDTFLAGSGMEKTASDIVSHLSYTPTSWFDITTRQRFDNRTLQVRFAEGLSSWGPDWLKMSAGYTYSLTNPYLFYDTPGATALATTPRNEGVVGLATKYDTWHFKATARRDLALDKMVSVAGNAGYEDECFIFDVSLERRYTSINNDHGASTILFELTFKTVGQFGFHAL
jgi:LPS-assembly protein